MELKAASAPAAAPPHSVPAADPSLEPQASIPSASPGGPSKSLIRPDGPDIGAFSQHLLPFNLSFAAGRDELCHASLLDANYVHLGIVEGSFHQVYPSFLH